MTIDVPWRLSLCARPLPRVESDTFVRFVTFVVNSCVVESGRWLHRLSLKRDFIPN